LFRISKFRKLWFRGLRVCFTKPEKKMYYNPELRVSGLPYRSLERFLKPRTYLGNFQ